MTARARVLLIDDETVFLESMSKILRARGYEVRTAVNGVAGLEELGFNAYDVVVLDQKMPGLDGISTLERIHRDHPTLPVIMLSGHAQVSTAIDALDRGADDYLLKPALVETLCQRIQAAIERKHLLEGVQP